MRFWRSIASLLAGILSGFVSGQWIAGSGAFLACWVALHLTSRIVARLISARNFQKHSGPFRKSFGPYGQKILKAAQSDPRVRKHLDGVFSGKRKQVEESVRHLEVFSELARIGMRGRQIDDEASDLALSYGKERLKKNDFGGRSG